MKIRKFEKGGFATTEDSDKNRDTLGDLIVRKDVDRDRDRLGEFIVKKGLDRDRDRLSEIEIERMRGKQTERMEQLANSAESQGRTVGEPYVAEKPEVSAVTSVAAAPKVKPPIVTKEQLKGMSLRDYMNEKQGLTRRKDKVNPTLGEAKDKNAQDAADAIDPGDIRTREIGKTRGGPSYDIAGKPSNAGPDVEYKPQSLNKRTGATAKMMSDFNNQANKRTGRGYASGGSVSASRRGDGIAQRGKTRGRMC